MRRRRNPLVAILVLVTSVTSLGLAAPAAAAEEPAYYLPAPAGTTLVVKRGNDERAGRSEGQEHAFDLVAAEGPERFPVVAARGGTVIGTRSGVRGGRCREPLDDPRPRCWRQVNYVLIDHGDGTSALYLHLRRGEPLVRRGEVVSRGQPIGTAGGSGWTDGVGLGFQVQRTPTWNEIGQGGWFLTRSLPVAFADPDVTAQRPDGVPLAGDAIVSGNPGPAFEPFRLRRRPDGLPASVPFEPGMEVHVSSAYDADAPDGYGLRFSPAAATDDIGEAAVRPLFGGTLAFAGCAGGESASLGRTVAIELEVDGTPYLALHAHLAGIALALLEPDPSLPAPIVSPGDVIGTVGAPNDPVEDPGTTAVDCPAADPAGELFVSILRNGTITPDGEIVGGTPVSPEPLVGELGYEGFAWWRGPVVAAEVAAEPGRPRTRWNPRTPDSGTHVPFGETVTLRARVRDVSDIAQVRFRAWYPRWPQVGDSSELPRFDPASTWRQLAVCMAPGQEPSGIGSLCQWEGDGQDAKVTYVWDPQTARPQPSAPWLPRPSRAMTRSTTDCVPVSFAVEVIDRAGHVHSRVGRLPMPEACDDDRAEAVERALVLYLDPLVPPRAPRRLSSPNWRVFQPRPSDDDDGIVRWRDRADNEDGYRVYARRAYFAPDCSIELGPFVLIEELPANRGRYDPRHAAIIRRTPVDLPEAPGTLTGYQLYVAAWNEAGESQRVQVGSFSRERGFFCDTGLLPPPELEP